MINRNTDKSVNGIAGHRSVCVEEEEEKEKRPRKKNFGFYFAALRLVEPLSAVASRFTILGIMC